MDAPEAQLEDPRMIVMGQVTFHVASQHRLSQPADRPPQLTLEPDPGRDDTDPDTDLHPVDVSRVMDFLKPELDRMVHALDDRMRVARMELRPSGSFDIVVELHGLATALIDVSAGIDQLTTIGRLGEQLVRGFLRAVDVAVDYVTTGVLPSPALLAGLARRPTPEAVVPASAGVPSAGEHSPDPPSERTPTEGSDRGTDAATSAARPDGADAMVAVPHSAVRERFFTLVVTSLSLISAGLIVIVLVLLAQQG